MHVIFATTTLILLSFRYPESSAPSPPPKCIMHIQSHIPLFFLFFSPLLTTGVVALPKSHHQTSFPRVRHTTNISTRQSPPSNSSNTYLAEIASFFPVNLVITEVFSLITAAETAFADIYGYATSEDDLVSGNGCGDILIVFARGVTEPGNVGALVGPPFFNAVRERLAAINERTGNKTELKLAAQGVDPYEATVEEFLKGGDSGGSTRM
jgi:hypothetical protein